MTAATAVPGLVIGVVIGFYAHASQWTGSSPADMAEAARARSAPVREDTTGGGGGGTTAPQ